MALLPGDPSPRRRRRIVNPLYRSGQAPTPTGPLSTGYVRTGPAPAPPLPSAFAAGGVPFGDDPGVMARMQYQGVEQRRQQILQQAAQRRQANDYAKQYQTKGGGFFGATVSAAAYARRDNISLAEASRRVKNARTATVRLKSSFQSNNLYSGDMSGNYNPMLNEAVTAEGADLMGDTAASDAALGRLKSIYEKQTTTRKRQLTVKAQEAQKTLAQGDLLRGVLAAANFGKAGLDEQTLAYLQQVQARVSNPKAAQRDPAQILHDLQVVQSIARTVQDAQPKGFGEKALSTVGEALGPLSVPMEQLVMQPYYASKLAQNDGGGLGRQLASGVSGLPGLGFLAGGVSARDRAATDSVEERTVLTEQGRIQSLGQSFSDALLGQLSGATVGNGDYRPFKGMYDNQSLSAPIDAAFQMAADPLNFLTFGTSSFAQVGANAAEAAIRATAREAGLGFLRSSVSNVDALARTLGDDAARGLSGPAADAARAAVAEQVVTAQRAARTRFLTDTRRGHSLQKAVVEVVDKNFDAASIRKAIPGLDQRVAQEIAEAPSRNAAMDAFRRAFSTGEYNPSITLRRQLLGEAGVKLPGGVGLGPKVVRSKNGLFDMLGASTRRVRGTEVSSVSRSASASVHEYQTLRAGLARAEVRMEDAYAIIAPGVMGLSPMERLERVAEQVADSPGVRDMLERARRRVEDEALEAAGLKGTKVGIAHIDAVASSEDFEAFLKNSEVLGAMVAGDFGPDAAKQVVADATHGLTRTERSAGALLSDAIRQSGFDPAPAGGVGTKAGLGFDVKAPKVRSLPKAGEIRQTIVSAGHTAGFAKRAATALRKTQGALDSMNVLLMRAEASLLNAGDDLSAFGFLDPDEATAYVRDLRGQVDELQQRFTGQQEKFGLGSKRGVKGGGAPTIADLNSLRHEIRDLGVDVRIHEAAQRLGREGYKAIDMGARKVSKELDAALKEFGPPKRLPRTDENLRNIRWLIEGRIPEDARRLLLDDLARATTDKKFTNLVRRVRTIVDNPEVRAEYVRLASTQEFLLNAVEELPTAGLMRRLSNTPLKLVNSFAEPVSPAHVAFLGYTNDAYAVSQRVEDVDRWGRDSGLDDFTRRFLSDSVARVKSEDDLFKAVSGTLRLLAARSGLSDEAQQAIMAIQDTGIREVKEGNSRIFLARVADGTVKVDEKVHTLAQRGELIYLPDPEDVRRTIREFKALEAGGLEGMRAKARVALSMPLDLKAFGFHGPVSGKELTIRDLLQWGHRKWKYLTVIPGAELAALGAVVGFAATDGDTGDRLEGAGKAAAIGMLTPLRYIMRVPGIEEGMRKYLAGGMNAEMWKPALSKTATQYGLDRPFTLQNAVRAGDPFGTKMDRLFATAVGESTTLEQADNFIQKVYRKDARYLDAYGRIINNQIHPETDPVMEMLVRRQAGEVTSEEVTQQFAQFIGTDAGKLWLRRMKGAANGPKNAEEAFANASTFVDTYLNDPEVAAARLDAARSYAQTGVKVDVDRGVLKTAQRRNALPEVVHAEKTFLIPKNMKQLARMRDRFTSMAFEGPTTALNRVPMANAIYRDEYTRLLRSGVEGKRAQEIAEQLAAERTNRIMFRINDESRFAAKADFIFPFQQPREEMLRVWAPLIANNPARAGHIARLAAVAFNNGKEKGMFTQDRYGDYRMTVPGSAWLSKTLFGSTSTFDMRINDLVFFGQGAYGVNVIPSPGGPYFGTIARAFINMNPEWYEGLDPKVRQWMFPYGSNGRLFRPEASRMWQAWTGDIPPWEFASGFEQRQALEKHRQEVWLQLIWQHGKETGDWSWTPTDSDWDDAVSASLKSWAFIGAVSPAGPGLLRPDQKAYDAIRAQYTSPDGAVDFIGLANDHPKFAPWITAGTEAVDDSDFDAWARTQDGPKDDGVGNATHRWRRKDSRDWAAEIKQNAQDAKGWKEFTDIGYYPADMQQPLYAAWDKKYPNLTAVKDNAFRRDIELMHIEGALDGNAKDEALNSWRQRYKVSYPKYQRLAAEVQQQTLRAGFNPWTASRPVEAIVDIVERGVNRKHYSQGKEGWAAREAAEQAEVSRLSVAEQMKYWYWRLENLEYDETDTPQAVVDKHYRIKQNLNPLRNSLPMRLSRLAKPDPAVDYTVAIENMTDDWRTVIKSTTDEAMAIHAQLKEMNAKKQYGATYTALSKKRAALFDMATAIKNVWYKSFPDMQGLVDDVKAVMVFSAKGDKNALRLIEENRKEQGFFLHSDEQAGFLNMGSGTQQAYVDDLVQNLNQEAFSDGKKYWSYLTKFQQDLMEANMPQEQVEAWKAHTPEMDKNKGGGWKRYSRNGGGGGYGELSYAYAMFKQYNKRTGNAPAAYKEYLALPNDAALRSAFLKTHPDVQAWVRSGPMSNMPPVTAMIVADIMIRNGKWEGESRTMTEITEIGFAREMMQRWSRRGEGASAPASYDLWVNMPTGVAKAEYIKAHPEIRDWIQLGPMANMPEAYREVVRDIMFRYGEWTDKQDPLGKTITEYYATPEYARQQFLQQHPELVEYWKATRSPEDSAKYDLADRYFAIRDPSAKAAFLQIHPELQQYFLDKRQRRYEQFLNRVAVYMGSNPELFTKYLDRQQEVLADLFTKFASAPTIRETFITRGEAPDKKRKRDKA